MGIDTLGTGEMGMKTAFGILAMATFVAAEARSAPPVEVVVRPEAAPGPLDNPLKGWCPYTDAKAIQQPYSMVYMYASWKELEPTRGKYEFDRWEKRAWAVPAAQGKHVVFRVYADYPSKPSGVPDWLKAEGVKFTKYDDHGGGQSPDYDDPKLVAGLERLIEAMGRRYDGDPRVAFVQLGLLGFWGEWHTYPRLDLSPGAETERRVIDAYHAAFPHKLLMARTANRDAGRRPWLGYHDDMFPEDTDNGQDWSFLAVIRKAKRDDNWKRAAMGGEMVPNAASKWLGEGYARTREMIDRSHASWVGPYCPALEDDTPESRSRSEALVRRLGYQFRLEEVRHPARIREGETLRVAIRGMNEGVAPFYYPWALKLALIGEEGKVVWASHANCDIRGWLPGAFRADLEAKVAAPRGNTGSPSGSKIRGRSGPRSHSRTGCPASRDGRSSRPSRSASEDQGNSRILMRRNSTGEPSASRQR